VSKQKDHEYMEKLDRCYKLVQQSSAKGGMTAVEIGAKMGAHRTTVHKYLKSLQYMGKVESDQGYWKATTGEQTIKPKEKEIEITLPLPKDEWQRLALLEHFTRDWEQSYPNDGDNAYRIMLDAFNETRTIKIKGKNVDDLDLEKVAMLIQQANERKSDFNLKGTLKKLKR
jgi:hypothetical protein